MKALVVLGMGTVILYSKCVYLPHQRPPLHKATFLWRTIYTAFTHIQTSLQRPISSVPKVAVEAGEVQLYYTSPLEDYFRQNV